VPDREIKLSKTGIFIISMGIISPVGQGVGETINSIRKDVRGIRPLCLFPTGHTPPLPVGEIDSFSFMENVPRTHALALYAAKEAMKDADRAPDAVVVGVTTGGMSVTEELLKRGETDSRLYSLHSTGSVAEYIARHVGCKGPVLTVSTACSSATVALKIALEMLRYGKVKQVLAGGADALCRLTYYGFHALQLVDATGAHPFDRNRLGMSVGEGAAMLLLTAADSPPENAIAELLGVGLSCDAYHPATPHPQGFGALHAMKEALSDACISPADIDYVHLHGTGTIDNDLAEARAVHALFGNQPLPLLSSIKGSVGHSLAAAGAMGAIAAVLSISEGLIPGNAGFHDPDPELNLTPVNAPTTADVNTALVNSFGFGGNNAVAVIGRPKRQGNTRTSSRARRPASFAVLGSACFTGAGNADQTIKKMSAGEELRGVVSSSDILRHISEKSVRRLQRLPRMVLSMGVSACENGEKAGDPSSIYLGTGWGGLSETHDFLTKLFASGERFSSPTDFIGSVHNAAAGNAAIHFKSTGPNITATGCECAFEQALIIASLLTHKGDDPILVVGADEYHKTLSPLLDSSVALAGTPSDGGGALYLKPATSRSPLQIYPSFMAFSGGGGQSIPALISELGGNKRIADQFGAVLVGIPEAHREMGTRQLNEFLSLTGYPHPIIDYRRFVGEFASASAVAAVLAVLFVQAGEIPGNVCHQRPLPLMGRGVLVLGLGNYITAMEVSP
jgi:3-oxoacyl-[acyl-carrier-protein] synthase-1/3-oxoacyl-[acyl-carrier-protein] synthase II